MKRTYYDNTQVSTFKDCPRKYYLRHIRGWTGSGISMPLVFGSSWHNAMDIIWAQYGKVSDNQLIKNAMVKFVDTWVEEGLPHPSEMTIKHIEDFGARTPMVAAEMLYSYVEARRQTFENPTFKLEAVEQPFAVPIYPERSDQWYIGRLDKVFSLNGSRIVGEHKTTSEYKIDGGFKSQWLDSWSPSSQIEGYMFAGNMYFDGGVRYVWIDGALVHKNVHNAFKFIPIAASLASLDGWLWEVRNWIEKIEIEKSKLYDVDTTSGNHMTCFPRNTDSCTGKYGPCTFKRLCSAVDNPAKLDLPPDTYVVKFWTPFDLLGIDKLGGEFTRPEENL